MGRRGIKKRGFHFRGDRRYHRATASRGDERFFYFSAYVPPLRAPRGGFSPVLRLAALSIEIPGQDRSRFLYTFSRVVRIALPHASICPCCCEIPGYARVNLSFSHDNR